MSSQALRLLAIVTLATLIGLFGLYAGSETLLSAFTLDESYTIDGAGVERIVAAASSVDVQVVFTESSAAAARLTGSGYVLWGSLPKLEAEKIGSTLTLSALSPSGTWWSQGDSVVLVIELPVAYGGALQITTASGDVRGESTGRDLASLSIRTSSGDQTLRRIAANSIVLQSSSGDITAERLRSETLEVTSSSGDIQITASHAAAAIRLTASSGDISLDLPAQGSAAVNAVTSSGTITAELAWDQQSTAEKTRLAAQIGDGQTAVEIRTSSGDIRLR